MCGGRKPWSAQGGIARSLAGVGTRPDSVALCVVRISLARRSLAERAWRPGPLADEATVEGGKPARVFFKHGIERAITRQPVDFSCFRTRAAFIRQYRLHAARINMCPAGPGSINTRLSRAEARLSPSPLLKPIEFGGLNLWPTLFCVAVAITILAGTSVWAKRSGIEWQNAHDAVFMIVAPVLTCIAFALIWAARDYLNCRICRYFAGAGCSGRESVVFGISLSLGGVWVNSVNPLERGLDWTTSCIIIAIVSLPFTLLIAWLSYVLVEIPFLQGTPFADYRKMIGGFLRGRSLR